MRRVVALAALLADPALRLEVVAGHEAVADCQIHAAAVSELTTPGKWLEGGELLMSIGLLLRMTRQACADYVADLTRAGVSAFALGLGGPELPYQAAPAVLVAAARRAGLPMITVPDGVPFIAVTKAVFALQAHEEQAELEWALRAHRAITEAAIRPGGLDAILTAHERISDCAGAVIDIGGRPLASAGGGPDDLIAHTAGLLESVRGRGMTAAADVQADGTRREVHALGARWPRGWLLLNGRADRTTSRLVTAGLVSLLSLELERRHAVDAVERRRRAQVFDRILRPDLDDLQVARILASLGFTDDPRRCVAVERPAAGVADELAADLASGLPDALVRVVRDTVELNVPESVDLLVALARLARGCAAGIGSATPPGATAVSLRQARSALAASKLTGRPVTADELASGQALSLLPAPLLQAYSDAVLGAVDADSRGAELIDTLAAFIDTNGSWERTARVLDVHRHTVSNRVSRVEQITGRSLDDPQARLELALAIHVRTGRRNDRPVGG